MDHAARFAATPANALLGLRLLARSPQRVEVELPVREDLLQEEGVVHGGLLTTMADTAAVWLLWPDLPAGRTMTSIDFTMTFLGPGRAGSGPLRAVAVPLRVGRSVAVCEAEVFQDGARLCKGTFHYLLRDRTP